MGNMVLNLMGLSWFKIESLNLGEFGVNCQNLVTIDIFRCLYTYSRQNLRYYLRDGGRDYG